MKTDRLLTYIIIALLLAMLFLQQECSRSTVEPEPRVTRTEVWHYDSTRYITQVPLPYPVEVLEMVPVEVPVVVDSFAIFQAYFKRYVYRRVLKDDSTAFVRLIDTVSQNRFTGSSLEFQLRKPVQHITYNTTIADPTARFFAGPMVGATFDGKLGLGATALYVSKRENAYSLTADPFARRIEISTLWKIQFRKHKPR